MGEVFTVLLSRIHSRKFSRFVASFTILVCVFLASFAFAQEDKTLTSIDQLADQVIHNGQFDLKKADQRTLLNIYISTFFKGSMLHIENISERIRWMQEEFKENPFLETDHLIFPYAHISFDEQIYSRNDDVSMFADEVGSRSYEIYHLNPDSPLWSDIPNVSNLWEETHQQLLKLHPGVDFTLQGFLSNGNYKEWWESLGKIVAKKIKTSKGQIARDAYRSLLNKIAQTYFWSNTDLVNEMLSGDGQRQVIRLSYALKEAPKNFFIDVLKESPDKFSYPMDWKIEEKLMQLEQIQKKLTILRSALREADVRQLTPYEMSFFSRLGYLCTTAAEWAVYNHKAYVGFTTTNPDKTSSGSVIIMLGNAIDASGKKRKIGIVEKIDSIDLQILPTVLESIRQILSIEDFTLTFPKQLNKDSLSKLSNDDAIIEFVENSDFYKNSKQTFTKFKELKIPSKKKFEHEYARIYDSLDSKIVSQIDIPSHATIAIQKAVEPTSITISFLDVKTELKKLREENTSESLNKYFLSMVTIEKNMVPEEYKYAMKTSQSFDDVKVSEKLAQAMLRFMRNQNVKKLEEMFIRSVNKFQTDNDIRGLSRWMQFYRNRTQGTNRDYVMLDFLKKNNSIFLKNRDNPKFHEWFLLTMSDMELFEEIKKTAITKNFEYMDVLLKISQTRFSHIIEKIYYQARVIALNDNNTEMREYVIKKQSQRESDSYFEYWSGDFDHAIKRSDESMIDYLFKEALTFASKGEDQKKAVSKELTETISRIFDSSWIIQLRKKVNSHNLEILKKIISYSLLEQSHYVQLAAEIGSIGNIEVGKYLLEFNSSPEVVEILSKNAVQFGRSELYGVIQGFNQNLSPQDQEKTLHDALFVAIDSLHYDMVRSIAANPNMTISVLDEALKKIDDEKWGSDEDVKYLQKQRKLLAKKSGPLKDTPGKYPKQHFDSESWGGDVDHLFSFMHPQDGPTDSYERDQPGLAGEGPLRAGQFGSSFGRGNDALAAGGGGTNNNSQNINNKTRNPIDQLAYEINHHAVIDLTKRDNQTLLSLYLSSKVDGNKANIINTDERIQEMIQFYQENPYILMNRPQFGSAEVRFEQIIYKSDERVYAISMEMEKYASDLAKLNKDNPIWSGIKGIDSIWQEAYKNAKVRTGLNDPIHRVILRRQSVWHEELAKVIFNRMMFAEGTDKELYAKLLNKIAVTSFWSNKNNVNDIKDSKIDDQILKISNALESAPREFLNNTLAVNQSFQFQPPDDLQVRSKIDLLKNIRSNLVIDKKEIKSLRVDQIPVHAMPFLSEYGYHCTTQKFWKLYSSPSYVAFTTTDENEVSKSSVVLMLGTAKFDGQTAKVAEIEQYDYVAPEFVPIITETIRRILSQNDYVLLNPKDLMKDTASNISNNPEIVKAIEEANFYKNSTKLFTDFVPLTDESKFKHPYARLFKADDSKEGLQVEPIDLAANVNIQLVQPDTNPRKLSMNLASVSEELQKLRKSESTDDYKIYFKSLTGVSSSVFPVEEKEAYKLALTFYKSNYSEAVSQSMLRYAHTNDHPLFEKMFRVARDNYKNSGDLNGLNRWMNYSNSKMHDGELDWVAATILAKNYDFLIEFGESNSSKRWSKIVNDPYVKEIALQYAALENNIPMIETFANDKSISEEGKVRALTAAMEMGNIEAMKAIGSDHFTSAMIEKSYENYRTHSIIGIEIPVIEEDKFEDLEIVKPWTVQVTLSRFKNANSKIAAKILENAVDVERWKVIKILLTEHVFDEPAYEKVMNIAVESGEWDIVDLVLEKIQFSKEALSRITATLEMAGNRGQIRRFLSQRNLSVEDAILGYDNAIYYGHNEEALRILSSPNTPPHVMKHAYWDASERFDWKQAEAIIKLDTFLDKVGDVSLILLDLYDYKKDRLVNLILQKREMSENILKITIEDLRKLDPDRNYSKKIVEKALLACEAQLTKIKSSNENSGNISNGEQDHSKSKKKGDYRDRYGLNGVLDQGLPWRHPDDGGEGVVREVYRSGSDPRRPGQFGSGFGRGNDALAAGGGGSSGENVNANLTAAELVKNIRNGDDFKAFVEQHNYEQRRRSTKQIHTYADYVRLREEFGYPEELTDGLEGEEFGKLKAFLVRYDDRPQTIPEVPLTSRVNHPPKLGTNEYSKIAYEAIKNADFEGFKSAWDLTNEAKHNPFLEYNGKSLWETLQNEYFESLFVTAREPSNPELKLPTIKYAKYRETIAPIKRTDPVSVAQISILRKWIQDGKVNDKVQLKKIKALEKIVEIIISKEGAYKFFDAAVYLEPMSFFKQSAGYDHLEDIKLMSPWMSEKSINDALQFAATLKAPAVLEYLLQDKRVTDPMVKEAVANANRDSEDVSAKALKCRELLKQPRGINIVKNGLFSSESLEKLPVVGPIMKVINDFGFNASAKVNGLLFRMDNRPAIDQIEESIRNTDAPKFEKLWKELNGNEQAVWFKDNEKKLQIIAANQYLEEIANVTDDSFKSYMDRKNIPSGVLLSPMQFKKWLEDHKGELPEGKNTDRLKSMEKILGVILPSDVLTAFYNGRLNSNIQIVSGNIVEDTKPTLTTKQTNEETKSKWEGDKAQSIGSGALINDDANHPMISNVISSWWNGLKEKVKGTLVEKPAVSSNAKVESQQTKEVVKVVGVPAVEGMDTGELEVKVGSLLTQMRKDASVFAKEQEEASKLIDALGRRSYFSALHQLGKINLQELSHGASEGFSKFVVSKMFAQMIEAMRDGRVSTDGFIDLAKEFRENAQFAAGMSVGTTIHDVLAMMTAEKMESETTDAVLMQHMAAQIGDNSVLAALKERSTVVRGFLRTQMGMLAANIINLALDPRSKGMDKVQFTTEIIKQQSTFLAAEIVVKDIALRGALEILTSSREIEVFLNTLKASARLNWWTDTVLLTASIVGGSTLGLYWSEFEENWKEKSTLADDYVRYKKEASTPKLVSIREHMNMYWHKTVMKEVEKAKHNVQVEQEIADRDTPGVELMTMYGGQKAFAVVDSKLTYSQQPKMQKVVQETSGGGWMMSSTMSLLAPPQKIEREEMTPGFYGWQNQKLKQKFIVTTEQARRQALAKTDEKLLSSAKRYRMAQKAMQQTLQNCQGAMCGLTLLMEQNAFEEASFELLHYGSEQDSHDPMYQDLQTMRLFDLAKTWDATGWMKAYAKIARESLPREHVLTPTAEELEASRALVEDMVVKLSGEDPIDPLEYHITTAQLRDGWVTSKANAQGFHPIATQDNTSGQFSLILPYDKSEKDVEYQVKETMYQAAYIKMCHQPKQEYSAFPAFMIHEMENHKINQKAYQSYRSHIPDTVWDNMKKWMQSNSYKTPGYLGMMQVFQAIELNPKMKYTDKQLPHRQALDEYVHYKYAFPLHQKPLDLLAPYIACPDQSTPSATPSRANFLH